MQLGPSTRRPAFAAIAVISRCSTAPFSSISAKPEERTMAAFTPLAMQSEIAPFTSFCGTTTIAMSTGPSTSASDL